MKEISEKVRGNALVAYLMVLVNISFLISHNPDVSHPFVKHHVRSAFILHILLLGVFFIMSYPFLDTIPIMWYSLNTIITILLSLGIFSSILYGMFRAYHGETMNFGDMFENVWIKTPTSHSSEAISEEYQSILILSHVPFLGYMLYPKHKKIPHVTDIIKINFLTTLLASCIFLIGYTSLSSLIMLVYIIWSVFNGSRLIMSHEISTPDLHMIPTMQESYILLISLTHYIINSLKRETFTPLKEIVHHTSLKNFETEKHNLEALKTLPKGNIPWALLYIPIINIIGIYSRKTRDIYHIKNGLILTLIFIFLSILWYEYSNLLLLFLFPICFWIWYLDRKAYKMPYIYDIYAVMSSILKKIWSLFSSARSLHKTHRKESVKIWDTPTKHDNS